MARYNSRRKYNKKLPVRGANYNSGPFAIIVLDNAFGSDDINSISANFSISDAGISNDNISATATLKISDQSILYNDDINLIMNMSISDSAGSTDLIKIPPIHIDVLDSIVSDDMLSLLPVLINLDDTARGDDELDLSMDIGIYDLAKGFEGLSATANIDLLDSGHGIDSDSKIASAFFVIDSNNILHPLGVLVTRDSRYELLPDTRDYTEELPGRHGEIDFGTEFKAKMMELHVATDEGNSPLEKAHLQRLFAKYLDPTKGAKTLIFSDDVEKTYMVKYSGKIDLQPHATWFDFTLPFKMSDPFIIGSFEKTLIGSGILVNEGNFETGLIIEISGPDTNPSLTIGEETLLYNSNIPDGQKLIIDTEKETAKIGNSNAIGDYNGAFPLLYPGESSVTAPNNATIKWRDKWI